MILLSNSNNPKHNFLDKRRSNPPDLVSSSLDINVFVALIFIVSSLLPVDLFVSFLYPFGLYSPGLSVKCELESLEERTFNTQMLLKFQDRSPVTLYLPVLIHTILFFWVRLFTILTLSHCYC